MNLRRVGHSTAGGSINCPDGGGEVRRKITPPHTHSSPWETMKNERCFLRARDLEPADSLGYVTAETKCLALYWGVILCEEKEGNERKLATFY